MAKTETRLSGMNIITENSDNGYVIQAFFNTLAALPDGSTYVGIFEPQATIQAAAGVAAGFYVNVGTTAVPDFEAVTSS